MYVPISSPLGSTSFLLGLHTCRGCCAFRGGGCVCLSVSFRFFVALFSLSMFASYLLTPLTVPLPSLVSFPPFNLTRPPGPCYPPTSTPPSLRRARTLRGCCCPPGCTTTSPPAPISRRRRRHRRPRPLAHRWPLRRWPRARGCLASYDRFSAPPCLRGSPPNVACMRTYAYVRMHAFMHMYNNFA